MLGQDVLETVARHRLSSGIEEQLRRITGGAHLQPRLHSRGRPLPEWQDPLAPPFADDVYRGHALAIDLIAPETNQLRYPHARCEGQVQHRAVADPEQGARVRCVE